MQQFTVPQFIDVEDKIIGPITTRQFIIMLGAFMLIVLCYKLMRFWVFVVSGFSIFGIAGMFAFMKVNGMPFHFFVLNFIQTTKRPSKRVWNNRLGYVFIKDEEIKDVRGEISIPTKRTPVTSSRLTELSLIVDTKGEYKGEVKTLNTKLKQAAETIDDEKIDLKIT